MDQNTEQAKYISYEQCLFKQKIEIVDHQVIQGQGGVLVTIKTDEVSTDCYMDGEGMEVEGNNFNFGETLSYLLQKLPLVEQNLLEKEMVFFKNNPWHSNEYFSDFFYEKLQDRIRNLIEKVWEFQIGNVSFSKTFENAVEFDLVLEEGKTKKRCLIDRVNTTFMGVAGKGNAGEEKLFGIMRELGPSVEQAIHSNLPGRNDFILLESGEFSFNEVIVPLVRKKVQETDEYRLLTLFN